MSFQKTVVKIIINVNILHVVNFKDYKCGINYKCIQTHDTSFK